MMTGRVSKDGLVPLFADGCIPHVEDAMAFKLKYVEETLITRRVD